MKTTFTFRHMDSSADLKAHTEGKLERLERFEDREMTVQVTFEVDNYRKAVEFQCAGSHGTFVSSETTDDMYESIDLAIDKLDRQLARDKEKRKHHKGSVSTSQTDLG
jgi:putative sigma-54 modulation protein